MHASIEFVRFAPELRRFARMVTGDQQRGDTLVTATLELTSKSRIDAGGAPARLVFMRALTDLWFGEYGIAMRQGEVESVSRYAYLLRNLAGLTAKDVCFVLRRDSQAVEKLIQEGAQFVARSQPASVLIIEDELFVATDLETIVEELGHKVVSLATTRDSAVAQAQAHRPDIILTDVHLADGSNGIDAAADIAAFHTAPTVFITAYPEHLLTGKGAEPAYLIEKPFRVDDIRANISQALFLSRRELVESVFHK